MVFEIDELRGIAFESIIDFRCLFLELMNKLILFWSFYGIQQNRLSFLEFNKIIFRIWNLNRFSLFVSEIDELHEIVSESKIDFRCLFPELKNKIIFFLLFMEFNKIVFRFLEM